MTFGAAEAAGTGKLTEVLAAVADDVVAVEPLDAVRRVLERHGAGETTIRFRAMITSAERLDG